MTGAANRDKGIRFERAVANYLGAVTTRSTRPGIHDDGGDVVLPGWLIECKDHGRLELGPWLDKADQARLGGQRAAVVVKRRQRPIGESFVMVNLATFREMALTPEEARVLDQWRGDQAALARLRKLRDDQ